MGNKSKLKLRSMTRNPEQASYTIASFVALLLNKKKGYEYAKVAEDDQQNK